MKSRRILSWLFLATIIVAIAVVWVQRLAIYDWYRLRGYNPPKTIVQLADDTTMTSSIRHLFYVNRPEVLDKSDFNNSCPNNGGEQTIILGCYHSGEMGIFIYSVTDPKLNGVMQVTAAHEALHSAYERLSVHDKELVNKLLLDFYKNDLKDKRIKNTIVAYQKTEPKDVVNEMHSIFGTEISNLPKPLEDYYNRYFKDRKKIVAYAQAYQRAFTIQKAKAAALLKQIKQIEQRLQVMKAQIDSSEASLNSQYQSLQASRNSSDAATYNTKVDAYNANVRSYRALISEYNYLVAQHNQLVTKYLAVATETNNLLQKLNSHSASVTTQ